MSDDNYVTTDKGISGEMIAIGIENQKILIVLGSGEERWFNFEEVRATNSSKHYLPEMSETDEINLLYNIGKRK